MAAVDSYIPEPVRDVDKPFLMPIEDVFTITGRGTVVTGRIEQGKLTVGEEVEIVGIHPQVEKTVVTGLEMFLKTLDYAQAGDNAGALLRGVKREEVERGQVLAKPGSITPHTQFKAEVYVLSKDEGGRHTPFFNGYRPQFYFRTTDVTGAIKLPEGQEMVMPGDNTNMEIDMHPADRHGPGPPLRDPRGRPHGRCRRRHGDHRVGARQLAPPSLTHMAQQKIRIRLEGLRPPAGGPLGVPDRGDGAAHRRDHHRSRPAADREERLLRDPQPVQGQGLA